MKYYTNMTLNGADLMSDTEESLEHCLQSISWSIHCSRLNNHPIRYLHTIAYDKGQVRVMDFSAEIERRVQAEIDTDAEFSDICDRLSISELSKKASAQIIHINEVRGNV